MKRESRLRVLLTGLALAGLTVIASSPATAQSFDCRKATTAVEKMVCANAELSKLDEDMAALFMQAKSKVDVNVIGQATWLRNVRNRCATVACVKDVYEDRITYLYTLVPVVKADESPAAKEFELWRMLPHVYAAIDGEEIADNLARAKRNGVEISPNELEIEYLTVQGKTSVGEGALVRLYTSEALIPSGTSYVALRRTHALLNVQNVAGATGTCVDADAGGACRAALTLEETVRLHNLIHAQTDMEQPVLFELRRRP